MTNAGWGQDFGKSVSRGMRRIRPFLVLALPLIFGFSQSVRSEIGCAPEDAADLSPLLDRIESLPEPGWLKANANDFSEVWTPAELRPLYLKSNPDPSKILLAWSSFAWDCRRGDVLLYGGGHANYPGNDTYRWRATTGRWERMSLPSQIMQDALGNWIAVDGAFAAPAAAHTYDNLVYLPIVDRWLVLGGAAFNNGGAYKIQSTSTTSRATGPYVFDLSRADGSRVGGTTGSHVQRVGAHPEISGGMMWQNRDLYQFMTGLPVFFSNGTTAYAEENGQDVVYISAVSGGTAQKLYRYVVRDPSDALADSVEIVGTYWEGFSGKGAGSLDPAKRIFVRTAVNTTSWFVYWNLNAAGPGNRNIRFTPVDLSGGFTLNRGYGLDFDLRRGHYAMWAGGSDVWLLKSPAVLAREGWTIERAPTAATIVPSQPPATLDGLEVGGGVLGKWKYIPELDAYLGIEDNVKGNIWIYKPAGWQRPLTSSAPRVTLSANPTSAYAGSASMLSWSSSSASSCEASGGWSGVKASSGTESTGAIQATQAFGLRCMGNGGEAYAEVTVTVTAPPVPTLNLAVTPDTIAVGGTSTLSWSTIDVTNCAAEGDWAGALSLSGSQKVGPLFEPSTFGVRCQGPGGEVYSEVSVNVVVNESPTVSLVQPVNGSSYTAGDAVTVEASASDNDGTVSVVDFFDGVTKIGEARSAPYRMTWTASGIGSHSITARVTDNLSGSSVSDTVSIDVSPSSSSGATITIQRGLAPGLVVADTYLSNWNKTGSLGSRADLSDQYSNYSILLRFAIFQSEGGPVPDGATVTSAVLSMYKYTSYNMVYGLYRVLKDWSESAASWNQTGKGGTWSVAGANGAGTDYAASADAVTSVGWSPEWVHFDVTGSVNLMGTSSSTNYGWRLKGSSGYLAGLKSFYSSEYSTVQDMRPKLIITYQ